MGTDYPSFLREATRVLKGGGRLWVAEVRSRFVQSGTEDFDSFQEAVAALGYKPVSRDASNRMFVVFQFQKQSSEATPRKSTEWPSLKPCLYKRR